MTRSAPRPETINAILSLVPPRESDRNLARLNLERLDEKELGALLDRLKCVEALSSGEPATAKPASDRHTLARAKLISGFSKLNTATKMLNDAGGQKLFSVEPDFVVTASDKSTQSSTAQEPAPSAARWEVIHEAADHWQQPLLMRTFRATEGDTTWRSAKINELIAADDEQAVVAVDESMIPVDKIQAAISKQIANVFEQIEIDRVQIAHIAELADILINDPVVEKYLRIRITSTIRDIFAMALERRLNIADLPQITPLFEGLQHWLRAPSAAVDIAFLSHLAPTLGETTAIEGFAKMVVRMREYDPQVVLVVKGGGEIAGKLVERTYARSANFYVFDPRAEQLTLQRKFTDHVTRVLIIDDIARTGQTMMRSFDRCRATFKHASVRGMTLVGTIESAALLSDRAFFPTMSPDRKVIVPWNKDGHYLETQKDHILGYGKPDSLSIAKELMGRAIGRLWAEEQS